MLRIYKGNKIKKELIVVLIHVIEGRHNVKLSSGGIIILNVHDFDCILYYQVLVSESINTYHDREVA